MDTSKRKKHSFEIDMAHGPILGKMLLFTLPLMGSSLLQLLFNAADVIVVGKFAGDFSLAAVGSTGSLINLITNLFIGLSVGGNVMVARYYGAGDQEHVKKTVHTAMLISLISGCFLAVVGFTFVRTFLIWMSTPENVLDLASLYLRIYFLGMPAMMVYNFGAAILRAVGDTKRPLFFLMGAGVINVCLNLLFVIVLKMDVAGVALATVISQTISASLVVFCMMREKGAVHLDLRLLHIDGRILGQILRIGLPAGIQGTVFSLSNVVIQSSINSFGELVMTGSSAAGNLEGFVYVSMNAFHHATLSFTSQSLGAGEYKRIRKVLLVGLACVTVTGTVLGQLMLFFSKELLSIYTDTPEAIAAGATRLKYVCGTYALCGIMDVLVGSIRGIGYAIMPMIVSLIGACASRLIWLATVFQIPKYHTIDCIFVTYPISWTLTICVHVICFMIVWKISKKKWGIAEKS